MRKYAVLAASLLVAFVLLTASSAKADSFSYTYTDGSVTATGTLTGNLMTPGTSYTLSTGAITIPADTFDITGGTITLSGALSGSGTLYANPSSTSYSTSTDGLFWYDDLLYPGRNPQLDIDGLLFEVGGIPVSINIWGNSPNSYSLYEGLGGYPYANGNGSFAATPEPVSMLLMGTFLSLAGGLLSKKKRAV